MTRFLLRTLALLAALAAGPVQADHSPEDVRAFAYAGDADGLESALDAMQEGVQAGAVPLDDQRKAYAVFATTHPGIGAFIQTWLESHPGSAHARVASSSYAYNWAWIVRGEDAGRWTAREAHEAFRSWGAFAKDQALAANGADPDLIPALDLLIRLSMVHDMPKPAGAYLDRIMALNPNHASVRSALWAAMPGWGGTWQEAARICDRHAGDVPDMPGYDSELCKLEAALITWNMDEIRQRKSLLANSDTAALERYLPKLAFTQIGQEAGLVERARAYMGSGDYWDVVKAEALEEQFPGEWGTGGLAEQVYAVALAHAREAIAHDPFNPDLISVLAMTEVNQQPVADPPTKAEMVDYAIRRLVARPYEASEWQNLGYEIAYGVDRADLPDGFPSVEEAFRNAIYFGNHSPGSIFNYRVRLLSEASSADRVSNRPKRLKPGSGFGVQATTSAEGMCEIIRTSRLLEAVCAAAPSACAYSKKVQMPESVVEIFDAARANRACTEELTAELQELVYTPVEFHMGAFVREDLRY